MREAPVIAFWLPWQRLGAKAAVPGARGTGIEVPEGITTENRFLGYRSDG